MKERGLIMTGPSIPALLNTKPGVWPAEPIDPTKPFKWQTRRVVKLPRGCAYDGHRPPGHPDSGDVFCSRTYEATGTHRVRNRYGIPGDGLWMREAYKTLGHGRNFGLEVHYMADGYDPAADYQNRERFRRILDPAPDRDDKWRPIEFGPWKSPLFMPRWASRAAFKLMEIRLEQLGTISEEDGRAEGVEPHPELRLGLDIILPSFRLGYLKRWTELHGSTPLASWVWVLTLARVA